MFYNWSPNSFSSLFAFEPFFVTFNWDSSLANESTLFFGLFFFGPFRFRRFPPPIAVDFGRFYYRYVFIMTSWKILENYFYAHFFSELKSYDFLIWVSYGFGSFNGHWTVTPRGIKFSQQGRGSIFTPRCRGQLPKETDRTIFHSQNEELSD